MWGLMIQQLDGGAFRVELFTHFKEANYYEKADAYSFTGHYLLSKS